MIYIQAIFIEKRGLIKIQVSKKTCLFNLKNNQLNKKQN